MTTTDPSASADALIADRLIRHHEPVGADTLWWETSFTAGIAAAIERSFRGLVTGVDPASVLGFAVLSDRRASALCSAALIRTEIDPLATADPVELLCLKTQPQRWVRRSTSGDPITDWGARFDRIGATIAAQDEAIFPHWRALAYAVVVGALTRLHQRGWFERWPNALRLFELTDLELAWVDRRAWIPLMNTPEVLQEYISFFNFVGPCESALQ